MFNLDRVHIILDEMIQNGHVVETNKSRILAPLTALDKMADGWGARLTGSDVIDWVSDGQVEIQGLDWTELRLFRRCSDAEETTGTLISMLAC